jgi:serine/threonine protein kinase
MKAPQSVEPGEFLGPYQVVRPIGAGGMGQVYLASDPRLNRQVAVKVSSLAFTGRFEREARAAASLSHPTFAPSMTWARIIW